MNKSAVIYARVSTDEQSKGYSIATQMEACQRYAGDKDYTVGATFTDDYTGASMDRPGLNELREYISQNPTDIIIVYDIDRLARKSVYQMLLEEEFQRHSALTEYVLGQYADTDEGRLQKQIRSSIAEYEKAKILERSKRGKRGKAKAGFVQVGSRPPYGYRVKSEPHKSWLEVNDDEAKIVRLVFGWYLKGNGEVRPMSMQSIAAALTRLELPTRGDQNSHVAKKRGVGVWQPAMVRHILLNETYTGTWFFGKTMMVSDGKEGFRKSLSKRGLGKQVPRPREDWIGVPVPSIVSNETFQMAQERLKLNFEQARRSTRREYLLGKRLTCAKCGYTYVGRTRRETNRYYYCKGSEQSPVKLCDMPNFQGNQLEQMVWDWVRGIIENPAYAAKGLADMQAEKGKANKPLQDRLRLIEGQITEIEKQQNKLLDLYLTGDFSKDILTERKNRVDERLSKLVKERADLSVHIQSVTFTEENLASFDQFCSQVRDGLDSLTFADKRRIFEILDVRAKLAFENNEKVVYVRCLIDQQRLSLVQTSHSSNTGATVMMPCESRRTARFP